MIFERERETERETEHGQGEGQRERETRNPKQAPGSRLQAVSTELDTGLKPMNREIMT